MWYRRLYVRTFREYPDHKGGWKRGYNRMDLGVDLVGGISCH